MNYNLMNYSTEEITEFEGPGCFVLGKCVEWMLIAYYFALLLIPATLDLRWAPAFNEMRRVCRLSCRHSRRPYQRYEPPRFDGEPPEPKIGRIIFGIVVAAAIGALLWFICTVKILAE